MRPPCRWLVSVLVLAASACRPEPPPRPNVLFIAVAVRPLHHRSGSGRLTSKRCSTHLIFHRVPSRANRSRARPCLEPSVPSATSRVNNVGVAEPHGCCCSVRP